VEGNEHWKGMHNTARNDILTTNFQQLLVTTFFLSFYWTITIERKKGRERVKVQ
jgi:hypothetical protein